MKKYTWWQIPVPQGVQPYMWNFHDGCLIFNDDLRGQILLSHFQLADTSALNSNMLLPSLCVHPISHQFIILYKYVTHQLTIVSSFYLSSSPNVKRIFNHPLICTTPSATRLRSVYMQVITLNPLPWCNWCTAADADNSFQFYMSHVRVTLKGISDWTLYLLTTYQL